MTNFKLIDYMESKDLKNSEELTRPVSDDSELTNEAENAASSSTDDSIDIDIVDEASQETADEADITGSEEVDAELTVAENEDNEPIAEAENPVTEEAPDHAIEPEEIAENVADETDQATVETSEDDVTAAGEPVEAMAAVEDGSGGSAAEETEVVETPVASEEIEPASELENTVTASAEEGVQDKTDIAPVEEINEQSVQSEPESTAGNVDTDDTTQDDGNAEGEDSHDDSEEETDYNQFSQIELVNTLRELIESGNARDRNINLIIAAFNLKVKENNAEKQKQFVEDGGIADEFIAEEDPYENDIRELVKKHRQTRFEQTKKMEAEKEINLQKKYEIGRAHV